MCLTPSLLTTIVPITPLWLTSRFRVSSTSDAIFLKHQYLLISFKTDSYILGTKLQWNQFGLAYLCFSYSACGGLLSPTLPRYVNSLLNISPCKICHNGATSYDFTQDSRFMAKVQDTDEDAMPVQLLLWLYFELALLMDLSHKGQVQLTSPCERTCVLSDFPS